MFSKEVTDQDGNKRTVVAGSQEDLKSLAKEVEGQSLPVSVDINKATKAETSLKPPVAEEAADDEEVVEGGEAHVVPGETSEVHVEKTDDPTE